MTLIAGDTDCVLARRSVPSQRDQQFVLIGAFQICIICDAENEMQGAVYGT
jgi:hypothetical protein